MKPDEPDGVVRGFRESEKKKKEEERSKKWWLVNPVNIVPALRNPEVLPDGDYEIRLPGKWAFKGKIRNSQLAEGFMKWDSGNSFQGEFELGMKIKKGQYHQIQTQNGTSIRIVFENSCSYHGGEIMFGTRTIYEDHDPFSKDAAKWISTYQGSFYQGKAKGVGVFRTKNKHYRGEFKNNLFDGYGKLTVFNLPLKKSEWVLEGLFKAGSLTNGISTYLQFYEADAGYRAQQKPLISSDYPKNPSLLSQSPPQVQRKPNQPIQEPPSVSLNLRIDFSKLWHKSGDYFEQEQKTGDYHNRQKNQNLTMYMPKAGASVPITTPSKNQSGKIPANTVSHLKSTREAEGHLRFNKAEAETIDQIKLRGGTLPISTFEDFSE